MIKKASNTSQSAALNVNSTNSSLLTLNLSQKSSAPSQITNTVRGKNSPTHLFKSIYTKILEKTAKTSAVHKYEIYIEAFRDEDDRLTFKQGSYLVPYIEKALNMKLPNELTLEIVN
jgi:hypothetical protein